MRYSSYLPIWRDANALLLAIEQAVRHFPRYHNYALGTELRRQAMAICRLIVRAYNERTRQAERVRRLAKALRGQGRAHALARWSPVAGPWARACPRSSRWPDPRARPEIRLGLGEGWSLPLGDGASVESCWQAQGQPYAVVAEEGRLRGGMKRRVLRRLFRPHPAADVFCSLMGPQPQRGQGRAHGR